MPEIVRERVVRSYGGKDRDDYSSDDDRSSYGRSRAGGSSYRTVQRYRVGPERDRVEPVEDIRRTSRVEIDRPGERVEIDRRTEIDRLRTTDHHRDRFFDGPERPRSSIDIHPRSGGFVERERERDITYERDSPRHSHRDVTVTERDTRVVERERDTPRESKYIERDRVIEVEREPFREPVRERQRISVVERERPREPENLRPWERGPSRPWEDEREVRETDVRIEKRTTERREEPYELERVQREIEYFDRPDPPPAPIIIRQRAPEPQQIIVQEAPQPAPIVIPREEQNYEIVRRTETQEVAPRPEPRREEEDYYYRRDVRVEGGRGREDDYAMAKYDRRDIRPRDSVSDREYSDGDDYVVRRRVVKQRSRSGSPHHKRHLAEGALAGAGIAALVGNHRDKQGDGPQHRGRNVVGGAALGAIGAEVVTRARSRFRERRSRSRSRSSSRHSHTKVKTALGLAVAGLAAAAAAKYVSNRNQNKEEMGRGRSRNRSRGYGRDSSYDSDYDTRTTRTRSKSVHADPKHRKAAIAKAGAATAAVAAIAHHVRERSRKRNGSRSHSRVRTGAEVVGAGLAGAAVAGLYENRKAKEEQNEIDREVEHDHIKRERRRSRSRARSVGVYSDPGVDPELGMVQYGTDPVYTTHQTTTYREFDGDDRGHHSRSHRRRDSSDSDDQRRRSRSRSRSRIRDIAGAAAATGAAAVGINQYKKRKEKKQAQRESERRRYEEESDNYYAREYPDDGYSPSPPHASGGSYYPENNQFPPPPESSFQPGFYQHPNVSTPHVAQPPIAPYNPADYAAGHPQQAPPAQHDHFGYPPVPRPGDNVSPRNTAHPVSPTLHPTNPTMSGANGNGEAPYFPPPPTNPFTQHPATEEARVTTYTPSSTPDSESTQRPHNKSVMFAPLSPTSSRRLARIRHNLEENPSRSATAPPDASESMTAPPRNTSTYLNYRNESPDQHDAEQESESESEYESRHRRRRRRRRNSDPSSNRPTESYRHRHRHHNASRSPSPASSDGTEFLPDRFDDQGRPLERGGATEAANPLSHISALFSSGGSSRGGGGHHNEMVENLVQDFTGVLDGRKTWKDMLKGLAAGVQGGGNGGGRDDEYDSEGDTSRRRRRR